MIILKLVVHCSPIRYETKILFCLQKIYIHNKKFIVYKKLLIDAILHFEYFIMQIKSITLIISNIYYISFRFFFLYQDEYKRQVMLQIKRKTLILF